MFFDTMAANLVVTWNNEMHTSKIFWNIIQSE